MEKGSMNPFNEYLTTGKMFSFSRWGDGEWLCLLGQKGSNCDGHQYFPELGQRLSSILMSHPKYYLGLQGLAHRLMPTQINAITNTLKLEWMDSDIYHKANQDGTISSFFDALKTRNVLLVGPQHLSKLNLFPYSFHKIPSRNCWLDYNKILRELTEKITPDMVVLFCASMMANVLIDDLDGKATLIDVGSVFDPYVGVKSRKYHHKMEIKPNV